ncbi:MAG: hypothetical protein GX881_06815, partial [Firmicutes bacterium]|nr:hypothetical protein [Bacillota bacterium]
MVYIKFAQGLNSRGSEFFMYALILAGGSGTRLWPLSREQ